MDPGLFLTKLLPALVYPPASGILLVLLALLLGWRGRTRLAGACLVVAISSLWITSTPLVARWLMAGLESAHPPLSVEATPSADAIVVLGGAIDPPHPPRHAPDLGPNADRVLHAARLYEAGKAPLVIVSGGNTVDQSNVEGESVYSAELLQEWGVPREAIAVEATSRTTRENALFTRDLLRERGMERVLLVTSAFHMKRAMGTFRGVGIVVVASSSDVSVVEREMPWIFLWIPRADSMAFTAMALKEYMGLQVYHLRGWLN